MKTLEVVSAGMVPYGAALEWQRELAQARIAGTLDHDLLLLLEHPPVITIGRTGTEAHVSAPAALLAQRGVPLFEVERGGDATYHGPGQLVGYPIFDLRAGSHRQDLHWYLRTVEAALIAALDRLGIAAERRPDYTGVWTRGGERKIASIGVHVKQWVTWHGFALNVNTDLSYFDLIVPCGIPDVVMTSIQREQEGGTGEQETLWNPTIAAVLYGFQQAFGFDRVVTSTDFYRPLPSSTVPSSSKNLANT
ncbi:MAG: lipoyl(octanoyl) transferase LipB [Gemmatimonadales bacterium]